MGHEMPQSKTVILLAVSELAVWLPVRPLRGAGGQNIPSAVPLGAVSAADIN